MKGFILIFLSSMQRWDTLIPMSSDLESLS
jgi:hypothetical protein